MVILNLNMLQKEYSISCLNPYSFKRYESEKLLDMMKTFLTYSAGALYINYNNCQAPSDLQNNTTLTEFEGSINGVFLSDFYKVTEDSRLDCVKSYCDVIKQYKDSYSIENKIVYIIKQIDSPSPDAYVCFHLLRQGEFYLSHNLDDYDEPLMIYIE